MRKTYSNKFLKFLILIGIAAAPAHAQVDATDSVYQAGLQRKPIIVAVVPRIDNIVDDALWSVPGFSLVANFVSMFESSDRKDFMSSRLQRFCDGFKNLGRFVALAFCLPACITAFAILYRRQGAQRKVPAKLIFIVLGIFVLCILIPELLSWVTVSPRSP